MLLIIPCVLYLVIRFVTHITVHNIHENINVSMNSELLQKRRKMFNSPVLLSFPLKTHTHTHTQFAPAARRARTSHSPPAGVTSLNGASGATGGVMMSERAAGGAVVASTATGAAAAAAGDGSVGVVLLKGGGVAGSSAYSLSKVDLAFPNNEHLLPISTFATEQGLTVPSNSQVLRCM